MKTFTKFASYLWALTAVSGLAVLSPVANAQQLVDDVYENNDTAGQALSSEFNLTDDETLLGLRQLDDDWWHIVVSPEDGNPPQIPPLPAASITIQIDCVFDQATAGNLDVELYVQSRAPEEQGVQAQGRLFMGARPTVGDRVLIGLKEYIWLANGTANEDGEIDIGADLDEAQANFVAAVNGTDGNNSPHPWVTASAFVLNTSVITAIEVGIVGNAIETTETFTSNFNFFDDDTLGATTLGEDTLLILVAFADSANDDESITLPNMAPGNYFIKVFGPNTGGAYSLWWDYLRDDVYEENDSYLQAKATQADDRASLLIPEAVTLTSLRQVDEDWFRVEILESGNVDLEVECNFVQATAGDINVELYNSTGSSVVGVGYSTTDNEFVVVPDVQPGTYYIRVYAGGPSANIGGEYTLRWSDSGNYLDDIYEENDVVADAVPIAESVTLESLRQVDDDWFEVTVSDGPGALQLQVDCTFDHLLAGDINVDVYNDTGVVRIGAGNSQTDNESIIVPDVQPGTYYIRVYAGGPDANVGGGYTLWWNDVGDFDDIVDPPPPPTPPDYTAQVDRYMGLASYYYQNYRYYGELDLANAYYSYYSGYAAYFVSLSSGDNVYTANYSLYTGFANYYRMTFTAAGDNESANMNYYFYLALAYYNYYLGIGEVDLANLAYNEILGAAFR